MRTRNWSPRRGALALLIPAALAAGCGGSSSRSDNPSPLPGAAPSQVAIGTKPLDDSRAGKQRHTAAPAHARATHKVQTKSAHRTVAAHPKGGSSPSKPATLQKSLKHSKRTRAAWIALTAQGVLQQFGFGSSRIHVDKDARGIAVLIPKKAACTASPSDEAKLGGLLRKALPFLRRVGITVTGTGQSLGSYVGAHCARPKMPAATGKLVLSMTGSDTSDTRAFHVSSSNWTVVYENDAGYFQAMVEKNGKLQPEVVVSQKRETGKKTFADGPGTFRLKIAASGTWTIKVYA